MILKTDWMINGKNFLDLEHQTYVVMAARKNFEDKLSEGSICHLFELIFHLLNVTTALKACKIYDETLRERKTKEALEFCKQLKSLGEKSVPGKILHYASKEFIELFSAYADKAMEKIGNLTFSMKNESIQAENVVYVLLNVSCSDVYDLWEIDTAPKDGMGVTSRITSFKMGSGFKKEFGKFIKEHNKIEANADITDKNTMVVTMEKAEDHTETIALVRDYILINKIFVGYQRKFDENVLVQIKKSIGESNVFPFHLVMV